MVDYKNKPLLLDAVSHQNVGNYGSPKFPDFCSAQ